MIARRLPNVLLRIFTNGQLANELLARELRDTGFTPSQFAFESVLGAVGPITPTELAARLGMAPTTLSAWIRRMSDVGHVRRTPNPEDGRSYLLELTPAGWRAFERAAPLFGAALRRIEAALGDDLGAVHDAEGALERALRSALETSTVSQ